MYGGGKGKGEKSGKAKGKTDESSSTVKNLLEKLKEIGDRSSVDESFLATSFSKNDSRLTLTPSKVSNGKTARQKLLVSSIARLNTGTATGVLQKVPSIQMKMLDDKARSVKDVNLNINLNLRVFPDQNEYQIYRGKQTEPPQPRIGYGPKPEYTKTAKSKKSSESGSRGLFKRKMRPEELRASSKDQSTESRLLKKLNTRSRYIDSDNSLSQKRLQNAASIPVNSLHIPNFGKVISALNGAEYKKASGSRTIRTRKSRNLENILTKYKQIQQEKTGEMDSARKENKSEKKGVATARSRIGGFVMESSRPTVDSTKQSKLNFKRKKLSLQYNHNNQSGSKEVQKHQVSGLGLNMAAASIYQTGIVVKSNKKDCFSRFQLEPKPRSELPDNTKLDKNTGSISSRTHNPTAGESSVLHQIVQNLNGKLSSHKLSLSTSTVPKQMGHKAADSKDVMSMKKLTMGDIKVKKEYRPKSGKGLIYIQGSKFNRMMHNDMQRKAESKDAGTKKSRGSCKALLKPPEVRSIDRTQEERSGRVRNRAETERGILGMHSYSKSEIQPALAGHLSNVHINTGLSGVKSKPQFSIPVSKIQSFAASIKPTK